MHDPRDPRPTPVGQPGEKPPTSSRRKNTSAGILLERASAALGAKSIAEALGIQASDLERFLSGETGMSSAQQRTLALAVLTLSDGHPDLRRRAMSLLGQVRATEEFEAGVTERHLSPPPARGWK